MDPRKEGMPLKTLSSQVSLWGWGSALGKPGSLGFWSPSAPRSGPCGAEILPLVDRSPRRLKVLSLSLTGPCLHSLGRSGREGGSQSLGQQGA